MKMTRKYKSARQTALANDITTNGDQEALYKRLNENALWWDSKAGEWVNFADQPSDEPSPTTMIRVWASEDKIDQVTEDTIKGLRGKLMCIKRSDPYPCRPPRQREHRVYLEFLPDESRSTIDKIIAENDPLAIEIE